MSIMIIIHNTEIDKLNNLVKSYPGTKCSTILEEKEYSTISVYTKDVDFVIESLLEDFDSVIISEIIGGGERYEEYE